MTEIPNNHNEQLSLGEYAQQAYLAYAMSVVRSRALPDVADGQKPVQRRILYAMHDMRLNAGAKPVKSARVVGEILGKYHPHGDFSAYDAMVRMAQDFTLRYPLIDGIGNFGSRDGDGAAAMRYTEARLTPIASLLLSELSMGTVDFMPNYDGAFEEPSVLPARLPFVLLNGASGIAVGLATEIPPHNLREVAAASVALLRNPNLQTAEILQYLPAPDFPGGGQIISSPDELLKIYETGKGSIRVRARYEVEKLARGQWRVVVSELPPAVSAQKILAQIEEMTNPKPKAGKKQLSQEQQNTKSLMLSLIDKVRDDSDNESPVRLVFEPKSSRLDPDEFINTLMANTDLECNSPINLVMMGGNGKPAQKGLKQILTEWLSFRVATVTRRLQYRLSEVQKRIHILQGRMTVFLHIDEVIKVIREADEPKPELMRAFGLTEIQAEDILEIRLRQLARLEWIKLESELAKLQEEEGNLKHLLSDETAKKRLIIKEIQDDAKQFGDDRRTLVEAAERAVSVQTVADEPITIILSQKGWVRTRQGHNLDLSQITFKDGDDLRQTVESRTVAEIVLLDNLGRSYTIAAADIPGGRGDGVPISSLIDLQAGAQIITLISGLPENRYLLANTGGYGFICAVKDMLSKVKAGKVLMTLNDNEKMLVPCAVPNSFRLPENNDTVIASEPQSGERGNLLMSERVPNLSGSLKVLLATSEPRILAFELAELRQMSKGRGLQLVNLPDKETLTHIILTDKEEYTVESTGRRGAVHTDTLRIVDVLNKRAKKGKPIHLSGSLKALKSVSKMVETAQNLI
ncbi:MAG: DNA topoisomerase IV subunit A [Neisseriaceae bacterium]|nr:DNA topoisomerase IV subunit A [Neisseriaceae bacterium]